MCADYLLCDYDNNTYIFLLFRILADISVLLIMANCQNLVIWLYSSNFIFCMLSGSEKKVEKKVRRIFFSSFFQQNSKWLTNHMLL